MNYYFLENPTLFSTHSLIIIGIAFVFGVLITGYLSYASWGDNYFPLACLFVIVVIAFSTVYVFFQSEVINQDTYYVSHDEVKAIHNVRLYDNGKIKDNKILSTDNDKYYKTKISNNNRYIDITVSYRMSDKVTQENLDNMRLNIYNQSEKDTTIESDLQAYLERELDKNLYDVDLDNQNEINNKLNKLEKEMNHFYGIIVDFKYK